MNPTNPENNEINPSEQSSQGIEPQTASVTTPEIIPTKAGSKFSRVVKNRKTAAIVLLLVVIIVAGWLFINAKQDKHENKVNTSQDASTSDEATADNLEIKSVDDLQKAKDILNKTVADKDAEKKRLDEAKQQ